jgi:hypothetical protein
MSGSLYEEAWNILRQSLYRHRLKGKGQAIRINDILIEMNRIEMTLRKEANKRWLRLNE